MLCTLFLPIIIGLCVMWYMILFYLPEPEGGFWIDRSIMLGLPIQLIVIALMAFPFLLWFWMLWSGNWRRPVLTAAVVYFAVAFVAAFELVEYYTPPEKRIIHLQGIAGADVYCNGVHLGQLPLTIRVDELVAKVPQWDTPPEQRWYSVTEHGQRLYTWLPWDNFLPERFEASRGFFSTTGNQNISITPRAIRARLEALNQHDADSRYWWSFRFGEAQMAFHRDGNPHYLNRPFDRQSTYQLLAAGIPFSPSAGFHAQLLVDVLPELTPEQKADWDRHVVAHWSLLAEPLQNALRQAARHQRRNNNEILAELYETALHSTARLMYGLSDPPTEEDSRRLLAAWVAESIEQGTFSFAWDWQGNSQQRPPTVRPNVLLPVDIQESMRRPLAEQWRTNKYRYERGWAPVAYFSWQHKSPDYFADFARWSAITGKARIALLDNEAPSTAALFRTLLHRRGLEHGLTWRTHLYPDQITFYSRVNNPLVEAEMREYIITALSDPRHTDSSRSRVEQAVIGAIFQRINRENIDRDELAAWIASLPLPASSRNLALRTLRLRGDDTLTFADQLQQAAGQRVLIETELTLDDVYNWFAENPDGRFPQFLEEQDEHILVSDMSDRGRFGHIPGFAIIDGMHGEMLVRQDSMDFGPSVAGGLPHWFTLALLRSDTPEGNPQIRELIKQIWIRDGFLVERALIQEYGINPQWNAHSLADIGSLHLPEYILDLYLSTEWEHPLEWRQHNTDMASLLALCESPKAGTILERWLGEASTTARPRIERSLEIWNTRNTLRQMRMEFFQDLVAGRIGPDDLLLPQPPWVWVDGEYVQDKSQ